MKFNPFPNLLSRISSIGASPGDPEDIRLWKSLLVISAFPFMISGIAWGIIYFLFGEQIAGLIPLSYVVFSMISVIWFGITRRFSFFRFSQLLLILLLPFTLMIALGGFIVRSAVIIWGLICPLGAMLVDKQRSSLGWLIAYLILLVICGILQPLLKFPNQPDNKSDHHIFYF